MGYLNKLEFNNLAKRIIHDPTLYNNKILADKAQYLDNNKTKSGILVLTNEKLSFITEKRDIEPFDIDLINQKPLIALVRKSILLTEISVNVRHFLLPNPRFWLKKISEIADNPEKLM